MASQTAPVKHPPYKRRSGKEKYSSDNRIKMEKKIEYKADIELPELPNQEEIPEWHNEKRNKMIKDYYDVIGKTPKKELKETPVDDLVESLFKFIKNERFRAFPTIQKENQVGDLTDKGGNENNTNVTVDITYSKRKQIISDKQKAGIKKLKAKARRNDWCCRFEHTGSVYEGLKAKQELEFDVMYVMKGDRFKCRPIPGEEGYFTIVQKKDQRQRSVLNSLLTRRVLPNEECQTSEKQHSTIKVNENHANVNDKRKGCEYVLSPKLVMERFESTVTRFMTSYKERKEKLKRKKKKEFNYKIRKHGPAIQVDVLKEEGVWYSVDLVPSYELREENILLVAKSPKVKDEMSDEGKFLVSNGWRISFSMYEKEKLKNLDEDRGCRRQVVRFLKGWSKCDPALHNITSYYWKNALFHLMDQTKDEGWTSDDFSERIFQLIWLMSKFVKNRQLPVYFNPRMNLIKDMTLGQSEHISKLLKSLYMRENKFDKVFQSIATDAINEGKSLKNENLPQDRSLQLLTNNRSQGDSDNGKEDDYDDIDALFHDNDCDIDASFDDNDGDIGASFDDKDSDIEHDIDASFDDKDSDIEYDIDASFDDKDSDIEYDIDASFDDKDSDIEYDIDASFDDKNSDIEYDIDASFDDKDSDIEYDIDASFDDKDSDIEYDIDASFDNKDSDIEYDIDASFDDKDSDIDASFDDDDVWY